MTEFKYKVERIPNSKNRKTIDLGEFDDYGSARIAGLISSIEHPESETTITKGGKTVCRMFKSKD